MNIEQIKLVCSTLEKEEAINKAISLTSSSIRKDFENFITTVIKDVARNKRNHSDIATSWTELMKKWDV